MKKRHLTPNIMAALADTPVVFLNGARQTGKSTLIQHISAHHFPANYITLDDLEMLAAAKSDPAGFIAGLQSPSIIDEVQRAPELFIPIKASVDRLRKPGQFLLTGSANILLLPHLSESLAGRMEILTLWPFSQGEIQDNTEIFIDKLFSDIKTNHFTKTPAIQKNNIINRILQGGYPEMLTRTSEDRRKTWFKSYVTTLIQRDVKSLAHIEGLTALPQLLSLLGSRTASLLNYAELSRTLGLAQTTLKRYMTLLETLFLVNFLPAWSSNQGKALVKSPKIMLNDTGLIAYLLGINATSLQNNSHLFGHVFENFVVNELRKQSGWSKTQVNFSHYRAPTGQEVDLVLENTEKNIVGIEIKAKTMLSENDFKGLKSLAELADKKFHRGIILYLGNNIVPITNNIHALPINTLWA